jgi:hypothetical protein
VPRTYTVEAELPITIHALDGMDSLSQLPAAAVQELNAHATPLQLTLHAESNPQIVQFHASAPSHAAAIARMDALHDQFALLLQHRADEWVSHYRAMLTKDADRLAAQEAAATHQLETFRLAHQNVLPDDPNSLPHQLEQLNEKIDDKQQRLHIVTAQITRLEAYKKQGLSSLPPPLPGATIASTGANPETDPEVLALTAQMQLLNDQVDDQLNNKHRTEQHPYVIDLRDQQAALQKKLDAARQRVANGQPPPSNTPAPLAGTPSSESSLAAAQGVDFQLQALQAEHDTLTDEMPTLTTQRQALQKQVDGIIPLRQEYEKLSAQLASIQQNRQTLTTRLEQLHRAVPADDSTGVVAVQLLIFSRNSDWPTFPQLPVVYALAVVIAAAITAALAWLLRTLDHTLHVPSEVSAILDIPVAGAIMELRTAQQKRREKLWRGLLRPMLALALLALTASSAIHCYQRLADAKTPQNVQDQDASAMLSPGASRGTCS